MKKVIISVLLILFAVVGCGDNSQENVILKNYEAEYNYGKDATVVNKALLDEIIVKKVKETIRSAEKETGEDYTLKIRLFVNDNGKLDFVKFIDTPKFVDTEFEKQITDVLKDFDYSKFVDGKYAFDISVNGADYFNEEAFLSNVEKTPKPVGGVKSIMEKIVYPDEAREKGIEGRVYVKAYIDENGNVVHAEILKGIGYGCDKAAINAVTGVHFTPGMVNGEPQKSTIIIPVMFRLQ